MSNPNRYTLMFTVGDDRIYNDLLAELYRGELFIGKFRMDYNNWPFRMRIEWSKEMLGIFGKLIERGRKIREREKLHDAPPERSSQEIMNFDL